MIKDKEKEIGALSQKLKLQKEEKQAVDQELRRVQNQQRLLSNKMKALDSINDQLEMENLKQKKEINSLGLELVELENLVLQTKTEYEKAVG